MKLPAESYIHSSNLSAHLPIITLYLPQISLDDTQEFTEYPVSVEFPKSIGCRTYHLSSQSTNSSDNEQTMESFIQDLLEQRKTMSDTDLVALKNNPCLTG